MAKILVADDSRVQVLLLSSYLTAKGHTLVLAADALQAWTAALREKPDVIVLDINMPGGSGIEVLKKLRMSTKTQQIPVVIVSGSDRPDLEQITKELGAMQFLSKPVDLDQLGAAIDRCCPPAAQ